MLFEQSRLHVLINMEHFDLWLEFLFSNDLVTGGVNEEFSANRRLVQHLT